MADSASAGGNPPPYPRRFGWGMRLFLAVLLFDMVFRSLSVCLAWRDWGDELGMSLHPEGDLAAVVRYLDPRPPEQTREELTTWPARGKYAVAWVNSRLALAENALGYHQEWPMFSPGANTDLWLARATLTYADGSVREARGHGDPVDLTRFAHWNEEKVLDHELKVQPDREDECHGYCNLLAHRYPVSAAGAPLETVRLFMVYYELPPPGLSASAVRAWLRKQSGPPEEQHGDYFYEYDARARTGRAL